MKKLYIKLLIVMLIVPMHTAGSVQLNLDSLLAKLPQSKNDNNKIQLLFNISLKYFNYKQDSALYFIDQLHILTNKLKSENGISKVNYLNSINFFQNQKFDSSLALTQKVYQYSIKNKDSIMLYRSFLMLGLINKNLKNLNQALSYFYKAKDISLLLKDNDFIFRIYNELGGLYTDLADYKNELRIRKEMFNWFKYTKDSLYLSFVAHGIAMFQIYKGYYNESIPWTKIALKCFQATHNKEFTAFSYLNLGQAETNLGHYDKAISWYLHALKTHEDSGSKQGMAADLDNIAGIYVQLKNYDEALKYYHKALKISNDAKYFVWQGTTYASIGNIYYELKQYDKAEHYFRLSLKTNIEYKSISGTAYSRLSLGGLQKLNQQYDSALANYLEALKLYKQVIENYGICNTLTQIADTWLQIGNYNKTISVAKEAMNIVKITNSKELEKTLTTILSLAYSKTGNYKYAYKYQVQASNLKDSLLNFDQSRQIGKIEANYQLRQKIETQKRQELQNQQIIQQAKNKRNNLEYLAVVIFVISSIIFIFLIRKSNISFIYIERYLFIVFMLTFEFISLLLNSTKYIIAQDDPLINLTASVILALVLMPMHDRIVNFILNKVRVNNSNNFIK